MQQELTVFYQFLYHVTPVAIFQVKSWLTLLKKNQAFYLAIMKSFLNFPPIPRIRSGQRISGIGGNF